MNKKKLLLLSLLTIPVSTLLIAENDTVTTQASEQNMDQLKQELEKTTKDIDAFVQELTPKEQAEFNRIVEQIESKMSEADQTSNEEVNVSQSVSEQNTALNTKPQETETLLEQRFICEQEGQEGGVVCQMYECLNEDCHAATAIKTENEEIIMPTKEFTREEIPPFDFDESEILCPMVEPQKALTPEDLSKEALAKSEETNALTMPKTASSELGVTTDIDVPSYETNQEIQQLKSEIKNAEKKCERAESDPLEKEICERSSANVQWRKQKIKALENQ